LLSNLFAKESCKAHYHQQAVRLARPQNSRAESECQLIEKKKNREKHSPWKQSGARCSYETCRFHLLELREKKSLISSKDVKQVTPASRVRFSFIERRCKSKNIAAMPLRRFLLLPPPALSHYDIKRKRKHRNQSATWNTNIFLFFGALEEDFGLPFAPFSVFRATLVAFLAFLKCSAARAGFFFGASYEH
jgi:hypothetical protein